MANPNAMLDRAERAYHAHLIKEDEYNRKMINDRINLIKAWIEKTFGSGYDTIRHLEETDEFGFRPGFWLSCSNEHFQVYERAGGFYMVQWDQCKRCNSWYDCADIEIEKPVHMGESLAKKVKHGDLEGHTCSPRTNHPICDPETCNNHEQEIVHVSEEDILQLSVSRPVHTKNQYDDKVTISPPPSPRLINGTATNDEGHRENYLNIQARRFVEHIKGHLHGEEVAVCKICDKDIHAIYTEGNQ